jgi:hypothetical protein
MNQLKWNKVLSFHFSTVLSSSSNPEGPSPVSKQPSTRRGPLSTISNSGEEQRLRVEEIRQRIKFSQELFAVCFKSSFQTSCHEENIIEIV